METMTFKLTKTVNFYELKPYGKFRIKFNTRQNTPNIIPVREIIFDSSKTMPVDDKLDKEIVKFMKKYKTDVFEDISGDFYTRCGYGFSQISHVKLDLYRDNEEFKALVDAE